jgi:hypothetical protein
MDYINVIHSTNRIYKNQKVGVDLGLCSVRKMQHCYFVLSRFVKMWLVLFGVLCQLQLH